MRTGPNRYDLSAGQLTPVRPEGKVLQGYSELEHHIC